MRKRKKYILIAASWFTVLLCWQFFSLYIIGNKDIFPSAFQLIAAVFYLFSEASFSSAILSTLLRGICGMLLSLCLAAILAWRASRSDAFRTYIHPFLTLFRSVPIISFLFLFLIWFSPEYIPLIMALITIVPVLTENLIAGFRNIDHSLLEMSYMYAFSIRQKVKHIIYPAVSPYLFSGLISTTGLGWKAIIMGEALAQPVTGIGVMIREAHGFIEVPRLLAWTLVAVVISYGFESLLKRIEKYSFPVSFASKDHAEKIMENFPDILNIEGIRKRYGHKILLSELQLSVSRGKITCLMASSGYGKTTLLRLLSGLDHAEAGDVSLKKNYRVAFLFQEYRLLPHLTVYENIALSRSSCMREETARKEITEILEQLDMRNCIDRFPETLSGGECQRVVLARTMFFPASLYLLDEPFKGLDFDLKQRVMDYLRKWQVRYGKTILYVTHQDDETRIADKIVRIQ